MRGRRAGRSRRTREGRSRDGAPGGAGRGRGRGAAGRGPGSQAPLEAARPGGGCPGRLFREERSPPTCLELGLHHLCCFELLNLGNQTSHRRQLSAASGLGGLPRPGA